MLQASLHLYRKAYGGVSRQMWCLAAIMLVNRSGTMVLPFLSVYLTARGYTLAQAGYIMGIFGAGAIFGGFLGGYLSDRVGFYKVQLVSLFFNGILFFVLSVMQTLLQIGICVFITSIVGEAFRPANAAAVTAYSTDATRTRSYSLSRLAVNLGWSVGPALGGMLAGISYSLLFWIDGITCILAALMLYFFLSNADKNETTMKKIQGDNIKILSPFRDSLFLTGMFLLLLILLTFFQLFNIIPVYYKMNLHLNEATIGGLLALNGFIIVVVEMILVYKLENKNTLSHIIKGCLFIGVSFLVYLLSSSLSVALVSVVLITFGEMFLFPFTNKFWVSLSSQYNRGRYAAAYTMTFALAQVLSPTLASQIAVGWGFNALWVVNFILCMLGAFGFYLLLKRNANDRISTARANQVV